MESFYTARLAGYVTRKANELARMDALLVELDARVRFVRAVVTGALVVANAEDDALLAGLKGLGLPALSGSGSGPSDLRGYEYLLRMRVDRLKAAAVLELEKELAAAAAERAALAARSPEELWLADLASFEAAYELFHKERVATRSTMIGTAVAAAKPKAKAVTKAKAPKAAKA